MTIVRADSQALHRLHELEWERSQLQFTHREAALKVKVFRESLSRQERMRWRKNGRTSPEIADAVKLIEECDRDLRRLSAEIESLRQQTGR